MSFKFNFGGVADDQNVSPSKNEPIKILRPCHIHDHHLSNENSSNFENYQWNTFEIGDVTMRFVDPECAPNHVTNSKITSLITSSDLNSGEYEGGLKVWECTYDLMQYLHENDVFDYKKARIMDMGCGAGLLGLFTLLRGAKVVYFQDYNSEVIDVFTLPTVSASLKDNDISNAKERVKFVSGDWDAVACDIKEKEKFDLILSSETIYNTEYYPKIHDFLNALLAPKGKALFAAKTHYFGVGGGTFDFVNFITGTELFDTEVVKKIDEGLTREILQVTKK